MPIQRARPVSGKFNPANKPTGSTSQKLCFLPEYPEFELSEIFTSGGKSPGLLDGGQDGTPAIPSFLRTGYAFYLLILAFGPCSSQRG